MLHILRRKIDKIIGVTTAVKISDFPSDLKTVRLIRRPNIGYDFYSYRVGIHAVLAEYSIEGIFLLNSSFLILNSTLFQDLIETMCDSDRKSGVRGLTASKQFGWHLQSYLIYFDVRNLPTAWLEQFFEKIEPVNSKFEVVLKYEIGLGSALQAEDIACEVIFQPNYFQRVMGAFAFMRSLYNVQGYRVCFTRSFWRARHDLNWAHFGAGDLAKRYGIVKAEFLRSNPHCLKQDVVWGSCEERLRSTITRSIGNTRQFYTVGKDGLSELTSETCSLGIILQIVEGLRYKVANLRVAVVVHLFYIDLFEEIFDDINNIIEPFDLYITTPFEADIPKIFDTAFKRGQSVVVILCRNKGRDVGPFVALYRTGRLDRYHAVLKLHTKKSRYSDQGDYWRRELYKPLCGDSMKVLRTLQLIREHSCGLVGPASYFLTSSAFWGANRERVGRILQSCGVSYACEEPELAFFAGTMFWFSPKALAAIHAANDDAIEFDLENGKQDGTLAHAWERSFSLIARGAGYFVSALELDGQDIFSFDSSSNKVPVLAPGNGVDSPVASEGLGATQGHPSSSGQSQ
jgi:rhamnosyltransferase